MKASSENNGLSSTTGYHSVRTTAFYPSMNNVLYSEYATPEYDATQDASSKIDGLSSNTGYHSVLTTAFYPSMNNVLDSEYTTPEYDSTQAASSQCNTYAECYDMPPSGIVAVTSTKHPADDNCIGTQPIIDKGSRHPITQYEGPNLASYQSVLTNVLDSEYATPEYDATQNAFSENNGLSSTTGYHSVLTTAFYPSMNSVLDSEYATPEYDAVGRSDYL